MQFDSILYLRWILTSFSNWHIKAICWMCPSRYIVINLLSGIYSGFAQICSSRFTVIHLLLGHCSTLLLKVHSYSPTDFWVVFKCTIIHLHFFCLLPFHLSVRLVKFIVFIMLVIFLLRWWQKFSVWIYSSIMIVNYWWFMNVHVLNDLYSSLFANVHLGVVNSLCGGDIYIVHLLWW